MRHRVERRPLKQRGQVLIIVAGALVGLIGIAALVIDGGNVFLDRRNAQNAADSAILAGAVTRVRGEQDWIGAVVASAAQNGYDNNGVTNIVQVYSPPTSGPNAGNIEYMQVIITSHVKTYFARVVGWKELTNVVSAVARTKAPEIKPLLGGDALISLAPASNCINQRSFWVHAEGTFDITGGGVFINSNNKSCALIQQGNGSVYMAEKNPIRVVGGVYIQKSRLISPVVSVGAGAVNYPPPFFMPKVECSKQAKVNEDGTTMSAGNWEGDFPPEGVKHLGPGIYCLKKGFTADRYTSIDGHNVVIKVAKGEFHISGAANINITAPETGELAGLLIYVPVDNGKRVTLNADGNSKFRGTILAPGSDILFKGSDSAYGFHSQIIGYRIELDGDSNVVIVYDESENYKAMTMPELQLSE